MFSPTKPIIISAPEPRSLKLIFSSSQLQLLKDTYEVIEITEHKIHTLNPEILRSAQYIIGQPPLSEELLAQLENLRGIFNVESNLIDNMPYETIFSRGIHVLTTGAVFALPVAELGLAFALNLARDLIKADNDFSEGTELWGGAGNLNAHTLSGSEIGIVGFGDVGRALKQLLSGFGCRVKVFDPWLPPSILRDQGVIPATFEEVFTETDLIFVVSAVTSENKGKIGQEAFESMRAGASFILLSRAEAVDFEALMACVSSGHIKAASDVFPQEPLALDHPVRSLKGFLRSAHRAGALDEAFKKMGDMVLEDLRLMDRNLPPARCKRAERETARKMQSKPVTQN